MTVTAPHRTFPFTVGPRFTFMECRLLSSPERSIACRVAVNASRVQEHLRCSKEGPGGSGVVCRCLGIRDAVRMRHSKMMEETAMALMTPFNLDRFFPFRIRSMTIFLLAGLSFPPRRE
jgi:hypothetical protein